jgi:hypothetical protein
MQTGSITLETMKGWICDATHNTFPGISILPMELFALHERVSNKCNSGVPLEEWNAIEVAWTSKNTHDINECKRMIEQQNVPSLLRDFTRRQVVPGCMFIATYDSGPLDSLDGDSHRACYIFVE